MVTHDLQIAEEYARERGNGIHKISRRLSSRTDVRYHVFTGENTNDELDAFRGHIVTMLCQYMEDYTLVAYEFITVS